ncbi:unnamed protein product [Rotaria magnacalcarata]
MFPQYNQRNIAGDIAIWLLITVGALLIPIIVIAICCIRHHCWKTIPARHPPPSLKKSTNHNELLTSNSAPWTQRVWDFSYNGPYVESGNDDRLVLSHSKTPPTLMHTNSIKKQHVHWPNGSKSPNGDDLRSIKDRQFTPRKQPFSGGDTLNTMMLTESPSSHRRLAVIPTPSSALSHLIQTAIMPAGSTITNSSASLLLTPSKQLTPNLTGYHSIV